MVSSAAKTVDAYLASLPPDRREVVSAMRRLVQANLPPGYVEAMNWGMVCYEVPLSRYPDTYNKQPLAYVALAAQKNFYAFYLAVHMDPPLEQNLRQAFAQIGRKPDMGKCCVRFSKLADVPLDAIGRTIATFDVDEYIALHEKYRGVGSATKSRKKAAATKATASTAASKRANAKSAAKKTVVKPASKATSRKPAGAKKTVARKATARKPGAKKAGARR
jgi:hypothetical protein